MMLGITEVKSAHIWSIPKPVTSISKLVFYSIPHDCLFECFLRTRGQKTMKAVKHQCQE